MLIRAGARWRIAMGCGLIAVLSFSLSAEIASAGKGKNKKKEPDLVATAASVDKPRYFFSDRPDERVELRVKIKNKGDAKAGKSTAELEFLEVQGEAVALVPTYRSKFEVDALKPGAAEKVEGSLPVSALKSLGRFAPTVCADSKDEIKEGAERNNCEPGTDVSVIPRRWSGTATASSTAASGVQQTSTANVTFTFEAEVPDSTGPATGGFTYRPTGTVGFTTSGTDQIGCSHSGTGDYEIGPANNAGSSLDLPADLASYGATGNLLIDESQRYPITVSCPGAGSFTRRGPDNLTWLSTGPIDKENDAAQLAGSFAPPSADGATQSWTWTLNAE